jgi:serine phosphatase RsbU (regulator of sigma subunit)
VYLSGGNADHEHQLSVEVVAWPYTLGAGRDEARLIQDLMLPSGTLRGDAFEIAFRFAPLGEVGGDFADFFSLPNGLVGMYMGDVVGKELIAALYASLEWARSAGSIKPAKTSPRCWGC